MCSDAPVRAALRQERFICANIDNNNNKFWNITLLPDFTVTTHWGRIGDSGQTKEFKHPDLESAERLFDKKCREKSSGAGSSGAKYVKQRTIDTGCSVAKERSKFHLAELAVKQIATNNPEAVTLVRELTRQNIHDILQHTQITLGDDGIFRTPLGVVTQEGIDEARRLLATIGRYVESDGYDEAPFKSAVEHYLMAVPQNLGHGRPDLRKLYPSPQAIQAQNQILDSLQASLQTVLTAPANPDVANPDPLPEPALFDAKLFLVEDRKTIDRITRKYQATQQSVHVSSAYKVNRVFGVEIAAMQSAFDREGSQFGNVQELWHGTSVGNILSILKSGLKIAPPATAHIAGKMFGNGIYFSDQSTKSLNYAAGYWHQGTASAQTCYMFLFNVAMGNAYTPHSPAECFGWTAAKPGYASTFAKGGRSGVLNNEMIVYRESQCAPAFLVEFTK